MIRVTPKSQQAELCLSYAVGGVGTESRSPFWNGPVSAFLVPGITWASGKRWSGARRAPWGSWTRPRPRSPQRSCPGRPVTDGPSGPSHPEMPILLLRLLFLLFSGEPTPVSWDADLQEGPPSEHVRQTAPCHVLDSDRPGLETCYPETPVDLWPGLFRWAARRRP